MTLRTEQPGWLPHTGALAIYAGISIVFIGHGTSLTKAIFGQGSDPFGSIWFLAWWPFAVAHHINPLYSHALWQPLGVAMMWVTSTPLLALLAAPVTLLKGPVLAYNFLILAAPVASALAAYFLCLRVTQSFWPALIGGYLFGFSAYEMAADLATLNLSVTLIVPLLVLLALVRLEGGVFRLSCVLLASLLMVTEFLISIEIFATAVMFGVFTWCLAYAMFPARRAGLRMLFVDALIAAPVTLLALSPFLCAMLADAHFVQHPAIWPYFFVTDLTNLLIPTKLTAIGGSASPILSHAYPKVLQEEDGYLGLPLLAILFLFAIDKGHGQTRRFLLVMFCLLLVASLGPVLWVAGIPTVIHLPWALALKLPLISAALPARFAMYVSLAAAIIAALWMAAGTGKQRAGRLGLGLLACIALLPAPHVWMKIPSSGFFQPGRLQAVLGLRPQLLVLPFGGTGPSTYWQVENHFGYTQSGGYLGFPPAAMQAYPATIQLFGGSEAKTFPADFKDFCIATKAQYVVAGPGTPAALWAVLAQLGWPAQKIDDVTVFTVPLPNRNEMLHD
jgi:hypothetical protein